MTDGKDVIRVGDKVIFTDRETGAVDERKIVSVKQRVDGAWVDITEAEFGRKPA